MKMIFTNFSILLETEKALKPYHKISLLRDYEPKLTVQLVEVEDYVKELIERDYKDKIEDLQSDIYRLCHLIFLNFDFEIDFSESCKIVSEILPIVKMEKLNHIIRRNFKENILYVFKFVEGLCLTTLIMASIENKRLSRDHILESFSKLSKLCPFRIEGLC